MYYGYLRWPYRGYPYAVIGQVDTLRRGPFFERRDIPIEARPLPSGVIIAPPVEQRVPFFARVDVPLKWREIGHTGLLIHKAPHSWYYDPTNTFPVWSKDRLAPHNSIVQVIETGIVEPSLGQLGQTYGAYYEWWKIITPSGGTGYLLYRFQVPGGKRAPGDPWLVPLYQQEGL